MEMFMVWVNGEFAGEFATEEEAREAARKLALARKRDAEVRRYTSDDDNEGAEVFSVGGAS